MPRKHESTIAVVVSCFRVLVALAAAAVPVCAQDPYAARAAIVSAEGRRAPAARDLAIIRSGLRAADPETVRIAVRALGRLQRTALVPSIVAMLRSPRPEVRAEAATALGEAVHGATTAAAVDSVAAALAARLPLEPEPAVRATIEETIGRLPYDDAPAATRAAQVLLAALGGADGVMDRLGVAKGFEALARLEPTPILPAEALAALRRLAIVAARTADVRTASMPRPAGRRGTSDVTGDARVRRLAMSALIAAKAVDPQTVAAAAADDDVQVRLLAMRAAADAGTGAAGAAAIARGVEDASPMVRVAALQSLAKRDAAGGCAGFVRAAADTDTTVALVALDGLRACGGSTAAVALLERTVNDLSEAASRRGWHRAAHALVGLAAASPVRAGVTLAQFSASRNPHLREYAARAAALLKDRATLIRLATDDDDNVVEAAIAALSAVAGHDADATYAAALSRSGYQVIRAAALALAGSADRATAVPALRQAFDRLMSEAHDNSLDERSAIAAALKTLGVVPPAIKSPAAARSATAVSAADLRRIAAARARITVRDVGAFDIALFPAEAPASVLRFVRLAESGYYNGLTVHRVVPGFVIQGGSPGRNEFVGDAMYMRDEVGGWPHVRGAVGVSTRGHDTGDAQFFVDLVDNPRLDHTFTVFAQVLNGIDNVDAILEGDVIERIDIILGSP